MAGIIGCRVFVPQWSEQAVIAGFDGRELCYHLIMASGDDAYVPMFFVEVLH